MMNLTTPHTSKPWGDAFNSLYPAIIQCFTIILIGYISSRAGWITSNQAKGLNFFTSKFALPSLLFSNMATLNWNMVEWQFLGAIFVSKTAMFIIAVILTFLFKRPANVGMAGLIGIFVTQSNDFALGYPIVKAIYESSQPQFLQYIYLIAPISLVILNPIGFILLEISSASSSDAHRSRGLMLLHVAKEISTNPIIIMTAAGVAANFIFNHHLPAIIDNLLSTLGQAFSACALFILGLSISGRSSKKMGSFMLGCGLLTFAKLLAFPMLTMALTRAFGCGSSHNATADYSMFAFLYGTFPTAPSVALYAAQYDTAIELVATALIVCTVASAPLMFVSAMMFCMQIFSMDMDSFLPQTTLDIGVMALLLSVAVTLLLVITGKAYKMPHMMVLIIAILQVIISVGAIIRSCTNPPIKGHRLEWWEYVEFILTCSGTLGVSTMTAVTALIMYLLDCRSLCSALIYRSWLLLYGLGLPFALTGIILIIGSLVEKTTENTSIVFGKVQMCVIAITLIFHIVLSVVLLTLRHHKLSSKAGTLLPEDSDTKRTSDASSVASSDLSESSTASLSLMDSTKGNPCYGSCTSFEQQEKPLRLSNRPPSPESINAKLIDIENYDSSKERMCKEYCSPEKRQRCAKALEKYGKKAGIEASQTDYEIGRVLVLLVLLILCQVVVVLFHTVQLFLPDLTLTGLFLELEFIYLVVGTGQGLFTFLIFGLGSEYVLARIKKWTQSIITKVKREQPTQSLSAATIHTCQQFQRFHLVHCKKTIDKRSKSGYFNGSTMINWLIEAGIASDSTEAQIYCEHLLEGRVIRGNKRNLCHFYDSSHHLYSFCL